MTEILVLFRFPDSESRSRKVYLVLADILGVVLGIVGNVGVLGNLGFSPNPVLNVALTTLILLGGFRPHRRADGKNGWEAAVVKETTEPIEVTGKLILTDERTGESTLAVIASGDRSKIAATPASVGSTGTVA